MPAFEDVLKEKILEPLNMKNTGYDHHETILKNRASGYNKSLTGYENAPFLDMSAPYAAGSLYSTVEDLFLWDQALYTDKLLSRENQDILFTPNLNNYAYGWSVVEAPLGKESANITVISHNGGINGFNTRIV